MKKSNKILLGGFLFPIVVVFIFVVFMSFNRTEDVNFQMGTQNRHFGTNNMSF